MLAWDQPCLEKCSRGSAQSCGVARLGREIQQVAWKFEWFQCLVKVLGNLVGDNGQEKCLRGSMQHYMCPTNTLSNEHLVFRLSACWYQDLIGPKYSGTRIRFNNEGLV